MTPLEPRRSSRARFLRRLEAMLWMLAVALFAPALVTPAARFVERHAAENRLERIEFVRSVAARQASGSDRTGRAAPPEPSTERGAAREGLTRELELVTDSGLWSAQRRAALLRIREALSLPEAIGLLELPVGGSRIPVYAGVSEASMTLGAGHLSDTASLDGAGTIALTAHRDGSFRALKDLQVGDVLTLRVPGGARRFEVRRFEIVSPDRVDVLDGHGRTRLVLITCFPFYHVGSAPERFIVHADLLMADRAMAAEPGVRIASAR